jgi:hypothetical protein
MNTKWPKVVAGVSESQRGRPSPTHEGAVGANRPLQALYQEQ